MECFFLEASKYPQKLHVTKKSIFVKNLILAHFACFSVNFTLGG